MDLLPEVEIRGDGQFPGSLPIGVPGKMAFRVLCRRSKSEGRGAPDSITAEKSLSARFVGAKTETKLADDLIETTRELEVSLPAGMEPGTGIGGFVLHWGDGHDRSQSIVWQVTPRITVSPSGLVVDPSKGRQTFAVVVRSDDRPFRIKSVTGSLLEAKGEGTEARTSHRIDLVIDPSRARDGSAHDLRVETDQPDQPVMAISILVLPGRTEAKP